MKLNCPHCGKSFVVKGNGRRPLNIVGKNVYATLQHGSSIAAVAEKLGASRGWVNNWVKQQMAMKLMTRQEFQTKYMPDIKRGKPGPKPRKHKGAIK